MKSLEFCYWLQGLFELQEPVELNEKQTDLIRRHLEMVFAYDKTPSNYCVFLNGFFKITQPLTIDAQQTQVMKQYLDNIFQHEAAPVKTVKTVEAVKKQSASNIRDVRLLC